MSKEYQAFREIKCDSCGRVFIPTAHYAYKEHYGSHIKYFCSWTCMLEYRKTHKRRKKRMVSQ